MVEGEVAVVREQYASTEYIGCSPDQDDLPHRTSKQSSAKCKYGEVRSRYGAGREESV